MQMESVIVTETPSSHPSAIADHMLLESDVYRVSKNLSLSSSHVHGIYLSVTVFVEL